VIVDRSDIFKRRKRAKKSGLWIESRESWFGDAECFGRFLDEGTAQFVLNSFVFPSLRWCKWTSKRSLRRISRRRWNQTQQFRRFFRRECLLWRTRDGSFGLGSAMTSIGGCSFSDLDPQRGTDRLQKRWLLYGEARGSYLQSFC
jgi:hypothetical protein